MKLIPIYASQDNPRQNILLITEQEKIYRLPLELWRNYLWFASTGRTWMPRRQFTRKILPVYDAPTVNSSGT